MAGGTDIEALVTDRAGVAAIFACTINNVNKLRSKGMPRMAHGRYSIPAVVQWRIEQLTNRAALDLDELPAAVEARTRLINAQEIHKRIEIRRLEEELIPADEVQTNMMELAQILITALEGLPTRAAQDLAKTTNAAEAVAVMREHTHDARVALETRIRALAEHSEPDCAPGAAAAAEERSGMGGCGTDRTTGESAPGALAV
jgi:phage terminase Nu1 subunit (DNA packaging protein)